MLKNQSIIDKALLATRESRDIEFKGEFDPQKKGQWCELIKDLMAIVNSGGGIIVFGLDSKGLPTGSDISQFLNLDPAEINDKIYSYTGMNFSEFEIVENKKNGANIACLILMRSIIPILPIRPGTYEKEPGKQVTAFSQGVFYYRHGPKSEPGTTHDLEIVINRNIKEVRREWMTGLRKISNAPRGSVLTFQPKDVRLTTQPDAQPFRLTDDINAPEFRLTDPNKTHPYRMKAFVRILNEKVHGLSKKISPYDINAVIDVKKLDANIKYIFKPTFGPRTFSIEFINLITEYINRDKYFLNQVRSKYRKKRRIEKSRR